MRQLLELAIVTYSEHVLVTRTASTCRKNTGQIPRHVPKKWRPPLLFDELSKKRVLRGRYLSFSVALGSPEVDLIKISEALDPVRPESEIAYLQTCDPESKKNAKMLFSNTEPPSPRNPKKHVKQI